MWPGVNVASHAHGYRIPPHPSNASRSSAPRGGRNDGNIGRPSQLVKRDSRKMNVFIVHKHGLLQRRKKSAPAARGADFFAAANATHLHDVAATAVARVERSVTRDYLTARHG